MMKTWKTFMMMAMSAGLVLGACSNENSGDGNSATISTEDASKTSTSNLTTANNANAAQNNANAVVDDVAKTVMSFDVLEHDFGKIDQMTENEYTFKFTNTGTEPLIISKAKGSCGCTVPEYPKEPIAPGEDGEIKVVYKPNKQKANQTKYVTVTANTDPADTRLKISADVQEIPEG